MPDIYSSQHETVHRTERKRTGQDADRTGPHGTRRNTQKVKNPKPKTVLIKVA